MSDSAEKFEKALCLEPGALLIQIKAVWQWATRLPLNADDSAVISFPKGFSAATDILQVKWAAIIWESSVKDCIENLNVSNFKKLYSIHQHLALFDAKMAHFRLTARRADAEPTSRKQTLEMAGTVWEEIISIQRRVVDDAEAIVKELLHISDINEYLKDCPGSENEAVLD